jgi:hypothetical protein
MRSALCATCIMKVRQPCRGAEDQPIVYPFSLLFRGEAEAACDRPLGPGSMTNPEERTWIFSCEANRH